MHCQLSPRPRGTRDVAGNMPGHSQGCIQINCPAGRELGRGCTIDCPRSAGSIIDVSGGFSGSVQNVFPRTAGRVIARTYPKMSHQIKYQATSVFYTHVRWWVARHHHPLGSIFYHIYSGIYSRWTLLQYSSRYATCIKLASQIPSPNISDCPMPRTCYLSKMLA